MFESAIARGHDFLPMGLEISHLVLGLELAACLALLVWTIRVLARLGQREDDFAPGPPTVPILGNALIFPTTFPYLKFTEWAQEYGDVVSLKVLNRNMVVISSAAAVKSILDINGAHTGNRIYSELIQRGTNGLHMGFENMESPVWKRARHAMQTFLTKESLAKHYAEQCRETSQFMHDILMEPNNVFEHICRTTVSVMTTLLYGSRIAKYKGSDAETYFRGTKLINQVIDPTAHPPVDVFWPLLYVPKRWAYWKRLADETRTVRDKLYNSLFERCERAIEAGVRTGCYLENMVLNPKKLGITLTREEFARTGATLMDGGGETTTSFLQSFILCMINHPDVQKKAQAEMDMIAPDRWPELEDWDNLPYLRAVIDELARYRTVLPISIPHLATKDIFYKGYRIPQGALLFMNVWGIVHDPELFDNPDDFDPERFMKTKFGTKVSKAEEAERTGFRDNFWFGAGRRICPGQVVARRTLLVNAMNLVWAFDFQKDNSGTGSLDFDCYSKPGLELTPERFTCNSKPRSAVKEQMIKDRFAQSFPNGVFDETKF